MTDTIFALSSGPPPAALAVIRVSGPDAASALQCLTGNLPRPRRATVAKLLDPEDQTTLDDALVLWMPGPSSATGEDVVELHLHGGRAIVSAVERALGSLPGLRRARAGEFTRRAFLRGRLDLAEAEGLADMLSAETELQRRAAMAMATGALSRQVNSWRAKLLLLSAQVEGVLDFSDEEDSAHLPVGFADACCQLEMDIAGWLAKPKAKILKDGYTVVLAGPPNVGKSTLFNALVDAEAAITSPFPGTTRDAVSRSVALDGVPFRFIDTAGMRDVTQDFIEEIGIKRAREAARSADLVLWLGPAGQAPIVDSLVWEIAARHDCADHDAKPAPGFAVSAVSNYGMAELRRALIEQARSALPRPGEVALHERQYRLLSVVAVEVGQAPCTPDVLLIAEHLRSARAALDALVGHSGTEAMLDSLFSRFCVGK